MKLQYRPAAIADIRNASDYIADVLKNRSAANRFKAKILEGVSLLKDNPYMGTPLASKYDGVPEDIRFLVISKQPGLGWPDRLSGTSVWLRRVGSKVH